MSALSASWMDDAVGRRPSGRRRESQSVWNSGSEVHRWKLSSTIGRTVKRRPLDDTASPAFGNSGFAAKEVDVADLAGSCFGADASRLTPKRRLPSGEDFSAAGCGDAVCPLVIISCTTASAVVCENEPISELTARAARGDWKARGSSHVGWWGVSSQRVGSSPFGALTVPAAATCQARLALTTSTSFLRLRRPPLPDEAIA